MRYTAQTVLDAEKFMHEQADLDSDLTVPDFVIRRQIRSAEHTLGHSRRT